MQTARRGHRAVAISQPFTLWTLLSFLLNIPGDMAESAPAVDCARFQVFRYVIIPVMWPGAITTGTCSFLLAYNVITVTSMHLSEHNEALIPKTAGFLRTAQAEDSVMFAAAAVVSAALLRSCLCASSGARSSAD